MNRLQELEIAHEVGPLATLIANVRVVILPCNSKYMVRTRRGSSWFESLRDLGLDISKIGCIIPKRFCGNRLSVETELKAALLAGEMFKVGEDLRKDLTYYWDFSTNELDESKFVRLQSKDGVITRRQYE